MAKCGVCGKFGGGRMISGITFCGTCFDNLQKVRSHDADAIQYYLDVNNYNEATDEAKKYMMNQAAINAEEVKEIAEEQKNNEEIDRVILTTTNSIEGYKIDKYLGIVCGEVVVPNGLIGAIASGTFFTISALDKARTEAFQIIKQKAYSMGANAIVAVDIDINDLNGNGVMVSVNGTAVLIESIEL